MAAKKRAARRRSVAFARPDALEPKAPPAVVPSGVVIPLPPEMAEAVAHYAELGAELVATLGALRDAARAVRTQVEQDTRATRRRSRRR